MLLLVLLVPSLPDSPSTSSNRRARAAPDECSNLTVAFNPSTHVLIITGHGYIFPSCVDTQYLPIATSLIIGEGITSVGEPGYYYGCFPGYTALDTITLP
jgi:hypothetical protein